MTPHCISRGLAIGGFSFGIAGAWFWFLSARVKFQRPADGPFGPTGPNDPMGFEPVEPDLKAGWYAYWQTKASEQLAVAAEQSWNAMVDANQKMGLLNTIAAGLTAVSVLLSTLSTLAG
ncbi:hypothetical protein [Burkholderia anthina]|uniref:hypothetical protein n=1 Tax=Burkholderia anthina TaxID=179879 RepID=UPI00158B0774|nr:hypothetical protein [Burkholderia anthina]